MYDAKTNELYFPHVLPGGRLDGKQYKFNDIDGGIKYLSDFNLIRNRFLGGSVEFMGLNTETGFWLCPNYANKNIVAFWIRAGEDITERGMEILRGIYGKDVKISGALTKKANKVITEENLKRKSELTEKALELGAKAQHVNTSTVDELQGLIDAIQSGKSGLTVEVEPDKKEAGVPRKELEVKHNSPPRKK